MSSGKTSIGAKLSSLLGYRFLDTDQWIEGEMCQTITEIFSIHGESVFRQKELECMDFLFNQEKIIISSGGGMPCNNKIIDLMNEMGETVYLKTPIDILVSRLWFGRVNRPSISFFKDEKSLREFVSTELINRENIYNQSKYTINTMDKSVSEVSNEIKLLFR